MLEDHKQGSGEGCLGVEHIDNNGDVQASIYRPRTSSKPPEDVNCAPSIQTFVHCSAIQPLEAGATSSIAIFRQKRPLCAVLQTVRPEEPGEPFLISQKFGFIFCAFGWSSCSFSFLLLCGSALVRARAPCCCCFCRVSLKQVCNAWR